MPNDTKEVDNLFDQVRPIILNQGNVFIKELLRDNNITIGTTKEDFDKNIRAAIKAGELTQEMLDNWLVQVEGWGNHHIYLYPSLFLTPSNILNRIERSDRSALLDQSLSYEFPDELKLTDINVGNSLVSISWHKGHSGWVRVMSKDHQKEEDGDLFEYRAHRQRHDRNVVRFEYDKNNPFSALFVQLPNEGTLHSSAINKVLSDISTLGIPTRRMKAINLSNAFKALSRKEDVATQTAKMMAHGGHVEFGSTGSGGISKVAAVRHVRRAVDEDEFHSAEGVYHFRQSEFSALSRDIKLQGYGVESRLRIAAQCKRDDIYEILKHIWAANDDS